MGVLPFYMVFSFIFALGSLDVSRGRRVYAVFQFWLIFSMLALFASFRSVGVGSDDQAYLGIFYKVIPLFECEGFLCGYKYSDYNVEFGFFALLSVISVFGVSQYWLFGVVAFLSVYFNLSSVRLFSPYVGASALIYFTHFYLAKELNAIRVGLASALLFYAAGLMARHRYVWMIFVFILAVSLHVSSVFFIVPVAICVMSPGRRVVVLFGVLVILFSFYFDLNSFFYSLVGAGFIGEKIELYLNSEAYGHALSLFDVVNVKNLLVVLVSLIFWRRLSERYEWFGMSFYFFYAATFFRIFFGDFAILAGRGYSVISMFEYVLIPLLSFGLFGRYFGYLIISIYTLLTLWLNLNVSFGWGGGVEYFDDFY